MEQETPKERQSVFHFLSMYHRPNSLKLEVLKPYLGDFIFKGDAKNYSPFDYAVLTGFKEGVQYFSEIIEEENIDVKQKEFTKLLALASFSGNKTILKLIINLPVENKSFKGTFRSWNCFHYAAANDNYFVIAHLLQTIPGLEELLEQPDNLGRTPLMIGAGNPSTRNFLLLNGADPLTKDQLGKCCLDYLLEEPVGQTVMQLPDVCFGESRMVCILLFFIFPHCPSHLCRIGSMLQH